MGEAMKPAPQSFVLHPGHPSRANVLKNYMDFCARLDPSKAWQFTAEEFSPRRSNQANAYYWGVVLEAFVRQLQGWTKDDVHDYLLGERFGWETLAGLGRKRIRPLRRSSKLDKAEFAEYVDWCIAKALDHNVFVPPPGDYGYEQAA